MINVSESTKRAFMSDVSKKTIRVVFPELNQTYTNSSIDSESLKVTESISSKDSVEFVGCISSSLQINLYGISANIKGKKIEVYIKADNTDEIAIFKGIVDSVVIDSTSFFKKITAYDVLYTKGNTDVAGWYNSLFPNENTEKTLKQIRDSLCSYIGLTQKEVTLPNDSIVITKKFAPKTLKCITVLKSICQINGCCGIIGRDGLFDYRFITCVVNGLYPALDTFPGLTTLPQMANNVVFNFDFYEKLNYEEYFVKPMDSIQIRESEEVEGVTVGANGNKYIIQSNMFAQEIGSTAATTIATNILNRLSEVAFYPFSTKNNGLPFVEVGDAITYTLSNNSEYRTNAFVVLSRTLSGAQLLKDTFSATGEEEQSEFITDLQTQLDTIKRNGVNMENYYTKDEMDTYLEENYASLDETTEMVTEQVQTQIEQMETPTGITVASVYTLPSSRNANTLYCIRGLVTMI